VIVHARPDPARHVLASLSIGLAFGLLFALFAECGNVAESQDQDYAHALAVVTLNEADFRASPRDFGVVHQAASYHADTDAGRLRWLRSHSRRVLADRPCLGGNCRWTRPLWRDPEARPETIPRGAWRPELVERALRFSRLLATGSVRLVPCPVPIVSWGNGEDFGPGEVRVDCGARIFGLAARGDG
jgi:hypothetical protein